MKPIYEGKAKQIFESDNSEHYVVHFKNSATAFNALKKAEFDGKGALNQKISAIIFRYLESKSIPTHFVRSINETDMLVKKVTIIPIEVVIRNISAGSLCKRYGIEAKKIIDPALVEFYYKNDALADPMLTQDHIHWMNLANEKELSTMKSMALNINDLMKAFFKRAGLLLVDFKLEFGKDKNGQIILADEISPDGCRLWDEKTLEVMDKDRFRQDMGGLIEAYQKVFDRIGEVV